MSQEMDSLKERKTCMQTVKTGNSVEWKIVSSRGTSIGNVDSFS